MNVLSERDSVLEENSFDPDDLERYNFQSSNDIDVLVCRLREEILEEAIERLMREYDQKERVQFFLWTLAQAWKRLWNFAERQMTLQFRDVEEDEEPDNSAPDGWLQLPILPKVIPVGGEDEDESLGSGSTYCSLKTVRLRTVYMTDKKKDTPKSGGWKRRRRKRSPQLSGITHLETFERKLRLLFPGRSIAMSGHFPKIYQYPSSYRGFRYEKYNLGKYLKPSMFRRSALPILLSIERQPGTIRQPKKKTESVAIIGGIRNKSVTPELTNL